MAKKSVKDLTTIFNFNNADYAHFCSPAGVDSKITYGELKTNILSSAGNLGINNARLFYCSYRLNGDYSPAQMIAGATTLTGTGGVALLAGQIVLRYHTDNKQYNGLWEIQTTGNAIRYSKANTGGLLMWSIAFIDAGTFAGKKYECTNYAASIDISPVEYQEIYTPTQPLNATDSPTFTNATIGGHNIDSELDTLNGWVNQDVKTTASPTFASLKTGVYTFTIDETKLLSDKADKTQLLNLSRIIYKQTTNATVVNMVAETSLLSGAAASRTIPANSLQVGDYIRFTAKGRMSSNNPTDTALVKFLFGGVDLLQSSQLQVSPSTLTNDFFSNDFDVKVISIGVSGSVQLQGSTIIHPGVSITQPLMREVGGGVITINTTQDIVIDETYTWGQANANCTITMTHATIEKM